MVTKLYKQFVAWGTNLLHRYQHDLFFRTTVHIILLQAVLITALLAVFWYALQYLQAGISGTVIETIYSLLTGNTVSDAELAQRLRDITIERFQSVAIILTALTFSFGLVTTYAALAPTRRSLERKKRFVSNVAHELRTPLAIIRSNTDLALMNSRISPDLQQTLQENVEELDRITEILSNLLTLSQVMDQKVLKTDFETVHITHVVTEALNSIKKIEEYKDAPVALEIYAEGTVKGKTVALEQVVFNLVKNALEHSSASTPVMVTVAASANHAFTITIRDQGSGIAQEDLFYIFEPFYRSNRSRRSRGNGLGLTLVSEIVKMHKGRITVKSKVGVGTTVVISVPAFEITRQTTPTADVQKSEQTSETNLDFSHSAPL